jgi:hypothetical protein
VTATGPAEHPFDLHVVATGDRVAAADGRASA